MNLRDLRYLVALADTLHFGKAAQRCHVSQPTLSAQLKKLEDYLGVELIERQPRRVALTDAGKDLVQRARKVLQETDEMLQFARNQRDPMSGQLRMALIPTIAPYLLPLVVKKLRKQLPRLKLHLFEYQTEPLLQQLRAGEIDLGILALPVPMDGLESSHLYTEDFAVALPKDHPLADRSTIKLTELSGNPLLLLEDGHCFRDQALEVCGKAGIEEDQEYRATSLETLRQMVAAGYGITLLPKLATRGPASANQGLVVKALAKPVPHRSIGAVWRKSSTRVAAIETVCKIIRTSLDAAELAA